MYNLKLATIIPPAKCHLNAGPTSSADWIALILSRRGVVPIPSPPSVTTHKGRLLVMLPIYFVIVDTCSIDNNYKHMELKALL